MTSIHRAGILIAAVAAVAAAGGFYALDGYLSAQHSAAIAAAPLSAQVAPAATATDTPGPEIVYVRPAPSPQVIHVTQTAPPAPPKVVHVTVPTTGGEPGEREGSGDGGEGFGGVDD